MLFQMLKIFYLLRKFYYTMETKHCVYETQNISKLLAVKDIALELDEARRSNKRILSLMQKNKALKKANAELRKANV